MKKSYYSHGKLLLTGEYFVLDGAQALAIPCKFGQVLEVSSSKQPGINWASYTKDGALWFQQYFSIPSIKETPKNDTNSVADTLQKILHHAYLLHPSFFDHLAVACKTKLEFPRDWGLGSSSTLINSIAQWIGIDAYTLLEHSFGGSGYDIAAAKSKKAFLYNRYASPRSREIELNWTFTDQIFFVHRNQKQDSKEGIARYRAKANSQEQKLAKINALTQDFIQSASIEDLTQAIEAHESFIAAEIEIQPIKEELFADYPHAIKSLGAWGGDFFMALGKEEDKAYFKNKGYDTILSYTDMVL